MKRLRILALALALLLALPAAGAYATAAGYGITVVVVGSVERKTIAHAKAAAEAAAAYLEANGISVFRSVPKTVKLYGTADLFLAGMREGGLFGEPVDEEKLAKTKASWRGMGGTVSAGTVHVNLSVVTPAEPETLKHIVAHEFTHLIQYESSAYSNTPHHRWLLEGAAELVAFAVTERLAGGTGNFAHGIGKILNNLEAQKSLPALSALADAEAFNSAIEALGKDAHKIVYGVATLGAWYLMFRSRRPLAALFEYMASYRNVSTDREGSFVRTFGIGTAAFYPQFEVYLASIRK